VSELTPQTTTTQLTFSAVSKVFEERFVTDGCLDTGPLRRCLLLECPFHNRVEPFFRYVCSLLHLVLLQFRNRPEIPQTRALRDDTLRKLERLCEATECVVRCAALVAHFCEARLGQCARQGVQIVSEKELGRTIKRKPGIQILSVDGKVERSDAGKDT